ncbi:MAG: PD-(D/E)XK motif protein, partial [Chthoniobacter sp.]|nr:PD-(D/E)XK motif protein [Chthoniobacter sp.]
MSESQPEVLQRVTNGLRALESCTCNNGLTRLALYPRIDNHLFVGFEEGSRNPLLLLQSKRKVTETIKLPRKREWFEAKFKKWKGDPPDSDYLVIELTDADYLDMFELVVAYVVKSVRNIERSFAMNVHKREAQEFNRSLKRWCRENPEEEKALGPKRQRGLYAELWFLRQYVLPHFDLPGLQYWVGSLGADHDFQFPTLSVEVKAIGAADEYPEIQISNEYQLDPIRRMDQRPTHDLDVAPKLYLLCLAIRDEDEEGRSFSVNDQGEESETLFALVESFRDRLGGNWSAFRSKLARAGYRRKHEKEYDSVPRRVVTANHSALYEVADKTATRRFPRIIRSYPSDPAPRVLASTLPIRFFGALPCSRHPNKTASPVRDGEAGDEIES